MLRDERVDVVIDGSCAVAIGSDGRLRRPDLAGPQISVKTALEADAQKHNPAAQHVCPLCGDWLPYDAFVRHAQACINARWPRHRVFPMDPGIKNVLAVLPERRKYGEV